MRTYEPIVAAPYLCVATILELIIKQVYPKCAITQFDIAEYFGVGIKKGIETSVQNVYFVEDEADIGIHIEKDSINRFFEFYNLYLRERFVSISTIADYDFERTIKSFLSTENFLVCGYSYGRLHNIKEKYQIGHVSLIENIEADLVEILDPGPLERGYKTVKVEDLYHAILSKQDGIWVIGTN